MPIIRIWILLSLLLGSLGVMESCNTTPPEYRRLFNLPVEQQALEFQKYSPEEQVEIFMYAVRAVEPPATQFGTFLAANGRRALPPVLAKLRQENKDSLKYRLVSVLYTMHRERCSLKDDAEVIEAIRGAISTMKDRDYRNLSEFSFKTIIEQPGAKKPC